MKDFQARGLAEGYARGRAHIRQLNAARMAIRKGQPLRAATQENNFAMRLTDSRGVIAPTDKGTVPAARK